MRTRSAFVARSLDRHAGLKKTHTGLAIYSQTNVGLLCSVGCGANVATVKDVGSWPFAWRECGFVTRRERGCLSLVCIVCCLVYVSATG